MLNKYNKLKIVANPIVNQSLCTMRSKDTDTQGVRLAARKLTRILLYEATKNLPQKDVEIETPLTKFTTQHLRRLPPCRLQGLRLHDPRPRYLWAASLSRPLHHSLPLHVRGQRRRRLHRLVQVRAQQRAR